ncbi:MAG: 1-(5-phosphoribosyl)-5-[(5-phosphoribosylamino)methylideneamino]imidazole-4-carboxamide isomerase [Anaerolineae bacterium]
MIIYPAIDLHQGNCVRLQQGELNAEMVFSSSPTEIAQRWAAEGAEWLHIVNLDGAFALNGQANLEALKLILAHISIPVQFGGGLRSLEDIQTILNLGVARVVLGTVALDKPDIVGQALQRWGPEIISVGIDARGGQVATHGWMNTSTTQVVEFALKLKKAGVTRVIYTDIERDGMLQGPNLQTTAELAASGLQVIASGGISSLDDILALKRLENDAVEGAIIGMALYRGVINLSEALRAARGEQNAG